MKINKDVRVFDDIALNNKNPKEIYETCAIDDIKKELQDIFKKPIDFVPNSNKNIMKDLIYV